MWERMNLAPHGDGNNSTEAEYYIIIPTVALWLSYRLSSGTLLITTVSDRNIPQLPKPSAGITVSPLLNQFRGLNNRAFQRDRSQTNVSKAHPNFKSTSLTP